MMYSIIGILASIILLTINKDVLWPGTSRQLTPTQRYYRYFLIGVLSYYITDLMWGILETNHLTTLLFIDTTIYFLAMAAAVVLWTRYVVAYLERDNAFGKILYLVGRIFFVLEVIAVAVNCFYPIMFWFDENGGYHAGSVRHVTLAIQILLFLLTSIYTLYVTSKSEGKAKRRHRTIGLFGIAMMIFIALQIAYPLLPLYAMGYMLGTCVLHVFVEEDKKKEYQHELEEALEREKIQKKELSESREALRNALTTAEAANRAKTTFLSNMSHEIRTPMNAIIGLDSLALRNESIPDETREYLEKIDGSARHLLGLINDILDMSRIESGRLLLRKEEFSFSGMLEQINTMVMTQCKEKGLEYECNLFGGVSDYYIGDDMKLKQVLINILSNAIKFTEAPGSVHMTVERTAVYGDHSTLKFVIKDDGIGMDEEYIPKLFDAFTQEDSSRSNKYGSTGLGMAITKSIVDLMNGTISVKSEKGIGTEFTVTVTLNNADHQGPITNYIDPRDMRILVVDDEEIAAEHARIVLDEVGIKADTCSDGKTALQMLEIQHTKHEPYNLVLLDWKMPEMDGLQVAKEIRQRYEKETTVVILTSFNWDEIMDDALHIGVDSFLAKPLFASNVIDEFERIARKNSMSIYKDVARADLKGRHILMAEDVMINAEIMKQIISIREASIDHAENGKIVVEMFEKSPIDYYDAILMDVRMPEMDGLEATRAIRALDRPDALMVPIVALTANAFDEDVQQSLQVGMNAHLSKPVDPEHLYQTLEELIGNRQDLD